jgi:FixJ family two-component response regulator
LFLRALQTCRPAAQLGISEVTLQVHRRNVMAKMGAASLADLVRIAQRIEIPLSDVGRAEGNNRA